MAKKDDTHPILQEIKNAAKGHQAFEKERGKDLIYGHALDIASKKLVNVDWNTACAMAKKGTLSLDDKPVKTEPMYQIHFPNVREGVLFPHQIKELSRQMELGTFDGKGKTIRFPDIDPLTKDVAEATRETLRALVESGEMIDTTGMNDDEIIKAFYDLIDQDKVAYTPVLIPVNEAHSYFDKTSDKIEDAMRYVRDGQETHILSGTQSLSDFVPGSKKVYYSKRNRLMSEWEDLLSDPHYEEIPYEIESFEEMGLWAKKHGGTLFFPTSSIVDLRDMTDHSFVIGRTRDAGKPFSIKDLIQQVRKENPSLDEDELIKIVRNKYHVPGGGMSFYLESLVHQILIENPSSVVTVLDGGKSMMGNPIQKSKSFVRSTNDKHAKTKFSARSR